MRKRSLVLREEAVKGIRHRESSTRAVDELNRLKAVRLYGTGMRMDELLDIIEGSERSVHRWVNQYEQHGIEGLQSQWVSTNASKLNPEQIEAIHKRLHEYSPDQVIPAEQRVNQGQFWTVSDLRIAVEMWYGVTYKDNDSYQHLFHKCNFSYQRSQRVYKSRPSEAEIAEFEAELEKK